MLLDLHCLHLGACAGRCSKYSKPESQARRTHASPVRELQGTLRRCAIAASGTNRQMTSDVVVQRNLAPTRGVAEDWGARHNIFIFATPRSHVTAPRQEHTVAVVDTCVPWCQVCEEDQAILECGSCGRSLCDMCWHWCSQWRCWGRFCAWCRWPETHECIQEAEHVHELFQQGVDVTETDDGRTSTGHPPADADWKRMD